MADQLIKYLAKYSAPAEVAAVHKTAPKEMEGFKPLQVGNLCRPNRAGGQD